MPISIRCSLSSPMRMGWVLFLVTFLGLLPGCAGPQAPETQDQPDSAAEQPQARRHLIILHTNDIHGQVLPLPATWLRDQEPKPLVGGLERVARYFDRVKQEAQATGSEVLVLDAGDWFQGTPEGGLHQGLPVMQVMAHMGYDALCVGNHEFDHGVTTLLSHLQVTALPALLANVQEPSGAYLAGTQPYAMFERAGSRIAVVGLLTTGTPAITHPTASQLIWNDEAETLRYWRKQLRGQCDWILPLTHMGIEEDEKLVHAVPGFPILIGGHSHTLLREGKLVGTTRILQAGSKGRGVGRIDLWIDPVTRQPEDIQVQVVNLFDDVVDGGEAQVVAELCDHAVKETEARMNVVVGELAEDMPRGRELWQTSPLGNLITEIMLQAAPGDVAIQNRGGIRASWKKGPITRRDVFSILPFDNTLVTLSMSGQEVFDFFAKRVAQGSTLELSGAVLIVDRDGAGWKLLGMEIGGQALDPKQTYRFVTNNYLAGGGDGFEELATVSERTHGGALQRDLVEAELVRRGVVHAPTGVRYRVVTAVR